MKLHPIASMTQAAVEAFTTSTDLDTMHDADSIDVLLEQVGNALRAKLPLPSELRAWTEHLALGQLGTALERVNERLAETPLPSSPTDADALHLCVHSRDRAESTFVAVRRACLGSARSLVDVPNAERTLALFSEIDSSLGEHVGQHAAELALELRIGLLGEKGWTHNLPEAASNDTEADPRWSWPKQSTSQPSDSIVTDYVGRGRHARWVESHAAQQPDFSEELRTTIEVFRASELDVSLVARRWMKGVTSATAGSAAIVPLGFKLLNAAASVVRSTQQELDLGVLDPTDAEALLVLNDAHATVTVCQGDMTIRRVVLGDSESISETRPGEWSVQARATEAPMPFVVETTNGKRFEAFLSLFAADPST